MFSAGETSFLTWVLSRVSFVYLALFVLGHLLGFALSGEARFADLPSLLTGRKEVLLAYIFFVPAVLTHILNGLYGAFAEWGPPPTILKLTRLTCVLLAIGGLYFGERTLLGLW